MIDYKINNKANTLILCIFGGYIGLHHFYNKQTGKGLLYLFTGGLFCIGWIIDIIKIINLKETENNENKKYCINCGVEVSHNDLFCTSCGYDLNAYKNKTNPQTQITNTNESNKNESEKSLYQKTKTKIMCDDYIVFDLETTGFDPKECKIIEIGALKYKNNELIDQFSILINPKEKLDEKITKITGITDDMLKDCDTIDNVLPKFIEWIEDYTLVAHNGNFDLGFIECKIKELNLQMITNKNIDTLTIARKYITETKNHKLETLKKHFNLEYESHRALSDCYVTNHVYQYCKKINNNSSN